MNPNPLALRGTLFSLILFAAVSSVGCITSGGNRLPEITTSVPGFQPFVEYTVSPTFSFHLDGGKLISSYKAGNDINEAILNRWRDKGVVRAYSYVRPGAASEIADYSLVLSGKQDGDSSIALQIISGLTLFVLPYYVDTSYSLHYELVEKNTGRSFKAAASNDFMTVVSLVLLPFSPFGQFARMRTINRLADTLYQDLHDQGAFQSAPPPALAKPAPPPQPQPVPTPKPEPRIETPAPPSVAPPRVSVPSDDPKHRSVEQRLQELDALRKRGLITDEEYQERRQAILSDL